MSTSRDLSNDQQRARVLSNKSVLGLHKVFDGYKRTLKKSKELHTWTLKARAVYWKPVFNILERNIKVHVGADGIVTSYLWGYKRLFPVAEIVNATYQELVNVLGQTVIEGLSTAPATDVELRQTLQPLRNAVALNKALITTYTYNPLTGITSVMDANSIITYYEYDTFGQLRLVKKAMEKLLKSMSIIIKYLKL